jgi:hypothetical protein
MASFAETRRTLAQCRRETAVAQFYRALCVARRAAGCRIESGRF